MRRAPNPTQSELSKRVNPGQLLDKILGTQLTLTVGEALGTSREILHTLVEALKYKRPAELRDNLVGATIFNRNRGELISLTLECDGRPLEALVDTGSMLNVMSKRVWQNVVKRPLEPADTKSMRDANGGEKPLMGKVSHVPFTCGGAVLFANVFVAAHVEFDLLLGRPWQQDNQVSISERRDGTYLIFDPPWMSGGPMELFVGTTLAPALEDGPYVPVAVPVFSAIASRAILSNESEGCNEKIMAYLPTREWEAHEDPESDVIVQARVPRAIAFPRGTGNWLGHPFEDWEVPGSSLVVTERHWTYQDDIVSNKYARTGYLLLRFFPESDHRVYKHQDDSYEVVYHGRTLINRSTSQVSEYPGLETIPEEPREAESDEEMDISEDEQDERDKDAGGDEGGARAKSEYGNPEEEPQGQSIMIDKSQIDSSDLAAQNSGTGAFPLLDCIDPALLDLPSSYLESPTLDDSHPTSLGIPDLFYPGNNVQEDLATHNDPESPSAMLEPCPTPSKAELRSLSHAIDLFLASVQEEQEVRMESASQQQEAEVAGELSTYVSRLRDSELTSILSLRPPTPHPTLAEPLWHAISTSPPAAHSSDISELDGTRTSTERPRKTFQRSPTPYPHAEIRAISRIPTSPSTPSPSVAPTVAPERIQSLSYELDTTPSNIDVPATPHDTPVDARSEPTLATLVVPDPDNASAHDAQVRTLPTQYARAFTAEYQVPDFVTQPHLAGATNSPIPVYTIHSPTPLALPCRIPPNSYAIPERAEGDAQNVGAGRPLSPFEDPADHSTRATTPEEASSHSNKPDTDDDDAEEQLREEEMRERISEFLAKALRPVTEDLVDFVRDEINEKHAEHLRKWSFRTRI